MRVSELNLIKYGHFADLSIDLDGDGPKLQLLYGPNEAGKSTALRGLLGLLFGFPHRAEDAHRHGATDLRVGARIVTQAGASLKLVRRRGRKDTLLDEEENPVDERILETLLRGMKLEVYTNLFGLDHARLVAGGRELTAGKGELGSAMFAASGGFRQLSRLKLDLSRQAAELFAPRASQRVINATLRSYQALRKEAEACMLRPAEWRERVAERDAARLEVEGRLAELREAAGRLARLERVRRVREPVERLKRVEEDLTGYEGYAPLPDDATERRLEAMRLLAAATGKLQELAQERKRIERRLAEIEVPEDLLERSEAVQHMQERLAAYRGARDELPALQAAVRASEQQAISARRTIDGASDLSATEHLRLSVDVQARFATLRDQYLQLETALERARSHRDRAQQRLDKHRRALADQPLAPDLRPLRTALARARREGDLDAQLLEANARVDRLAKRAIERLSALTLFSGSLEEVVSLPVPVKETVEGYLEADAELKSEAAALTEREKAARNKLEEVRAAMSELVRGEDLPTPADLAAARSLREEAWFRVRRALWEGTAADGGLEELAGAFETELRRADEVADRLLQESERLERHRTLRGDEQALVDELAATAEEQKQLADRRAGLEAAWREAWSEARITPLSPREMRGWLDRQRELKEAAETLAEAREEGAALELRIGSWRERLQAALKTVEPDTAPGEEKLNVLLDRAEELLERLSELGRKRESQERRVAEAAEELAEADRELSGLKAKMAAWLQAWRSFVGAAGLPSAAGPREAEPVLEARRALFDRLDDLARAKLELERARELIAIFESDARELIEACAADLSELPADQAASLLARRGTAAVKSAAEQEGLKRQLAAVDNKSREAERRRDEAEATLAELRRLAGAEDDLELKEAEERSKTFLALQSEKRSLEEQLAREGVPLAELAAQVTAVDADTLELDIERGRDASRQAEESERQARERLIKLEQAVAAMDGSDHAAQLMEGAQAHLSELTAQVREFTTVRLAAWVLERELEAYRERHQGPVLARASEVFKRLTRGSFEALAFGFAANDAMVLTCVRPSGERLGLEGLSDGTADQLFLALRIAGIERHLSTGEPLPVIMDDVLVNFDDERAQAALTAFAELARTTQVLLFTHHRRLLDLAGAALPDDAYSVHELDAHVAGAVGASSEAAL